MCSLLSLLFGSPHLWVSLPAHPEDELICTACEDEFICTACEDELICTACDFCHVLNKSASV